MRVEWVEMKGASQEKASRTIEQNKRTIVCGASLVHGMDCECAVLLQIFIRGSQLSFFLLQKINGEGWGKMS